jgi:putative transposase
MFTHRCTEDLQNKGIGGFFKATHHRLSGPKYIRCDNGPKLISKQLEKFCVKHAIELSFIQPRKPMQNGLIERLNGTVRRECLNLKVFKTIPEVQQDLDKWWNIYGRHSANFGRPHAALKGKTPQMVYQNQSYLQSKVVT